jgi:hypothetical protein
MGRLQTALKGVTTTSVYEDGDMYSLVNLRRKGGSLHPVLPYMPVGSIPAGFDQIYVHRNSGWERWTGFFASQEDPVLTQVAWFEAGGEVVEWITTNLPDRINSVEQSGNLLVYTSDRTQYYALFVNGHYKWYGEFPALPAVMFDCYEEFSSDFDGTDDGRVSVIELFMETDSVYEKESKLKNMTDTIKSIVNMGIRYVDSLYMGDADIKDSSYDFNGLFHDAFFVRYALRLYDNSYINYSPPILLMSSSNILDLLQMNLVTYPKMDSIMRIFLNGMYITGFMPGMKYDFGVLQEYGDLIKSVDIFISPYVGISNVDNLHIAMEEIKLVPNLEYRIRCVSEINDVMMQRARDMSSFYLLKSISIGEDSGGSYVPLIAKSDLETISSVRNLVQRPQLEESVFIHREGAKKTFAYNGRLHMADITTVFFGGWPANFFLWATNEGAYRYNGLSRAFVFSPGDGIVIETEINAGGVNGKVYAEQIAEQRTFGMGSAMWSYPDSRAKRATFYMVRSGKWYRLRTLELKEHEFLNVSYYLSDKLGPIEFSVDSPEEVTPVDTGEDFTITSEGEMRVSDVNNPLVYDIRNNLSFFGGRIMNMSTALMNISNDNYGQYPLYVFTGAGVYTLRVGEGNIPYSTVSQPVYAEAPLLDVVCPTPLGVVFVSMRGLMFINGTRLDYLSGQVEERPAVLRLPDIGEAGKILYDAGMSEGFREYMKGITSLTYGSYYNEIVIADTSKPYGWILDMESGAMFRTTNRAGKPVRNVFPASYNFHGSAIFDINSGAGEADVVMITRPLRYDIPDVKKMERIVLRGLFYGLKRMGEYEPLTGLLYSNDSRTFLFARGLYIKEGDRRDLDLGMFFRQQFREYIFVFAGRVSEGTKIEILESEVTKSYDNTKMR